jgi:hypothetical protein
MKRVLLALFLCCSLFTHAQYSSDYTENFGTVRLGAGYTRDFPGLNGYSVIGEYSHSLNDKLDGSFGVKRVQLSGYPRTKTVNEYTKATTVDFGVYYKALETDVQQIRIVVSYSFSFYKIRRSYPVTQTNGTDKTVTWPIQDSQGRVQGFNLVGEYEYFFPNSNLSVGLRAGLYKAYDRVTYIGPFMGVRL